MVLVGVERGGAATAAEEEEEEEEEERVPCLWDLPGLLQLGRTSTRCLGLFQVSWESLILPRQTRRAAMRTWRSLLS